MSTSLQCPLCGEPGSDLHILSGCKQSTIANMVTERHNIASRFLHKGVSKGPLRAGLASRTDGPPWMGHGHWQRRSSCFTESADP
eukprot:1156351-Pelagomonas_calceolata.AAC.3